MSFKNEEIIKEKIMEGKQRGVCDSEGNSITVNGRPKAAPRKFRPTKTYKNGRWIKVG